jgi:predicted PurR-regulated permease PerM
VTPERRQLHVAYRTVLLAAGLVALGLLFKTLATLMLLVLMTVVISIPLAALASRLERHGVPRPVGVLAGMAIGIAVIAGVLAIVIPTFIDQGREFVDNVPNIVQDLRNRVDKAAGEKHSAVGENVQSYVQKYTDHPEKLIGPLASIGVGLAGALATIILMLITAYYMAMNPGPLLESGLRLVPPARRDRALHILGRLRQSWIGWMQGVVFDMFISGTLLYLGLSLVGLDFALVFAVLSALLVVVPYFGAVAGGIPPVLFALTDSPGKALLVLAVYIAVQQVEGNLIIPLVMARTVKLHPAVIAIGVVLVGQVFGFVGLFVAVPILSAIVICVEELYIVPMELAERRSAADALTLPDDIRADPLDRKEEPDIVLPEELRSSS